MIALIPCRGGSKRVPNKNFRPLGGKPLVAWTIDAAHEAGLEKIFLCTDEPEKALDASTYSKAPDVTILHQPHPLHQDLSIDLEWISDALNQIRDLEHQEGFCAPCSLDIDHMRNREFILLRPTSPFRGPDTIRRALEQWEACRDRLDSLRAVRKATEHAYKQWMPLDNDPSLMGPVVQWAALDHSHSRPTQSLRPSYIQTAALEIFWAKTILEGSLSGSRVGMFVHEGASALDINTQEDWEQAKDLVEVVSFSRGATRA